MTIKLLIKQHLDFLSLKKGAWAPVSLFMSIYHIVGNHMSRLISTVRAVGIEVKTGKIEPFLNLDFTFHLLLHGPFHHWLVQPFIRLR